MIKRCKKVLTNEYVFNIMLVTREGNLAILKIYVNNKMIITYIIGGEIK